jgi:hypothetical protein
MRTVASTELLVLTPVMTSVSSPHTAQMLRESGADESAIRSFRDNGLARCRCDLVLEIVPLLAGPISRSRKG